MSKLLIVDGSNLLFQMFYGMPSRIYGKSGRAVHGTLGFVGALLRVIRMMSPTHVFTVFDGEHENPRASLDENYKANRTDYSDMPEEETPFSQLCDIYAALDFLGIHHAETGVCVCEADDVIAAYAENFSGEVVIMSQDSDFFQLISPRVYVLRYRGDKTVICGEEYITEKFGIPPSRYADFKSLTGDASDNIRGIAGVGVKTAACLIADFGSAEGVITHAGEIKKPSVRVAVMSGTERILTNYRLIRLTGDAPLPFGADELSYSYGGESCMGVMKSLGLM